MQDTTSLPEMQVNTGPTNTNIFPHHRAGLERSGISADTIRAASELQVLDNEVVIVSNIRRDR